MKNIYAYTGTTYPYPAYISINQKADSIEISIRNDGDTGIGCICLTEKQCEHLALALLEHSKPEADELRAEVAQRTADWKEATAKNRELQAELITTLGQQIEQEPVGYVDDYNSSGYYVANTPTNTYKTLKPVYRLASGAAQKENT